MFEGLRTSHVVAGFIAVLVGYTGSVAIVFQAAGATPAEINSWLLVLGGGMALSCIGLSWWYRAPVLTAWSTPGAALLATSLAGYGMAEAVGAFLVTGVLMLLTGLTGLFDRLIRLVPATIAAAALLAGILLRFGIDAFVQLQAEPAMVGAMLVAYFVGLRWVPRYAVPLALVAGCVIAAGSGLFDTGTILRLARPVWTTPRFSLGAMIGVSLPLYVVTMASQNVPGIAVLRSCGYQTPVSPLISWTGLLTIIGAPFGGFSYNLAAITAAICASDEAGADPKTRYLASIWAGLFYLLAALFGATIATLLAASPPALVLAIAGIALMSVVTGSLAASLQPEATRAAAGTTFLVAASGISFAGIGAAFWALVAGLVVLAALNPGRRGT